jgi:hypothetical protein
MYATDLFLDPARRSPSSSPAPIPNATIDALAMAKAHFVSRGWRPLSIQSPALRVQCRDVAAVLLMDGDGATAWLSARDWSAVVNPVDSFRQEMICIRAAKVDQAILVHDGEFPDAVIEIAAQEPGLKLVDALALRAMSGAHAPGNDAAAMRSGQQRFAWPARNAVASLHAHATRVVDTRLLPATERFVSKRLVQALRQMDGERRRLRNLVTGGLIVMGFAIGFLLFNLVILIRTPDDAAPPRVAATPRPALPAPLPPTEGYVAQAADVGRFVPAIRPAAMPRPAGGAAMVASGMPESRAQPDVVGTSAMIQTSLDDFAVSQMRADEAMRVIAADTPELRTGHAASLMQHESMQARQVPPADPAMVDGDPAVPDPADIP